MSAEPRGDAHAVSAGSHAHAGEQVGLEASPDTILTLEEAASLFSVSMKTFIKLLRDEDVPARKIGREWRFSRNALIGWLGTGRSRAYSDSEQEAKRYFDALAPGYESQQDANLDAGLRKALEQHCPPPENGLSLDYGAGTGLISRWLAAGHHRVLALDVSSGMLTELNRQAAARGLFGIETRLCETGDVPVADGSVQCVYASLCLHHLPDPAETIRSFGKSLSPGGSIAILELDPHADEAYRTANHDSWSGIPRDELSAWLTDAGFAMPRIAWESSSPDGKTFYLIVSAIPV